MPRILLRLPYGNSTIPCERFAFEEVSGKPDAKTMLWANPAPFCAMLLGQAFESSGWDMRPGAREIDNLPVYVYRPDGESLALPCAEVELTEDTAEALADHGLMPLVSICNSASASCDSSPLPTRHALCSDAGGRHGGIIRPGWSVWSVN